MHRSVSPWSRAWIGAALASVAACGASSDTTPDASSGRDGGRTGFDANFEKLDAQPGFDTPPKTCIDDESCQDARACNGEERCVDGLCTAGTPVTCEADAIDCTIEACVEPEGTCVTTAMDSLCPGGQICRMRIGCGVPCEDDLCDFVPQCGCASNEGCYPIQVGRDCFVSGSAQPGQTCNEVFDCVAGSVCVRVPGTDATRRCMRMCLADGQCPGAGSLCEFQVGESDVCSDRCDPLTQNGCLAGLACRILGPAPGGFFTACEASGTVQRGGACTSNQQCIAGHICIGERCLRVCDAPGGTGVGGCPGGVFCSGLSAGGQTIQIGGTEYGVCSQ